MVNLRYGASQHGGLVLVEESFWTLTCDFKGVSSLNSGSTPIWAHDLEGCGMLYFKVRKTFTINLHAFNEHLFYYGNQRYEERQPLSSRNCSSSEEIRCGRENNNGTWSMRYFVVSGQYKEGHSPSLAWEKHAGRCPNEEHIYPESWRIVAVAGQRVCWGHHSRKEFVTRAEAREA